MSIKSRVYKYAKANFNGVLHTSLNPEGPGVVRIHLIPPKFSEDGPGASIAIINGQDIIPVNTSWSILLAEFIKEINKYSGRALSDADVESVVAATVRGVRRVFPLLSKKLIRSELYTMIESLRQIACGMKPDEEVEYISLSEYAPFMKAPHRMDLMLSAMTKEGSWHCNQQCVHCYAAGQPQAEEKELGTGEWKKIIDKCREVGIPQLTFTGGEPSMREDLFELIEHASWFVTRLNTNGRKLSPEYCRELKRVSLDSMQITFYSCDRDIHNRLTGSDGYDDTVRGIENALTAGLNISVNTPLCALNKDYLKTLEFLHEKSLIYVTCSGLITTGNAGTGSSETVQLSKDEIKDILRKAADYCFKNGMEISFTSPGWIDKEFCLETGLSMPACGACLSNMAISPGGNVVPCQSWLSDDILGNILNDDWSAIWNSEGCRKNREFSALMNGVCPLRKHDTTGGRDE